MKFVLRGAVVAGGLALLVGSGVSLAGQEEQFLTNIRQLTFGGENTKIRFSTDGQRLIFQAMRSPETCDQVFAIDVGDGKLQRLSTGEGRTTCPHFLPGIQGYVFASTHLADTACPPRPPIELGQVLPLYSDYDVFIAEASTGTVRKLTDSPGYDADTAVSPDGSQIVFTSIRDGDAELYSIRPDGTGLKRLTHEKGFDGTATFSWDGRYIVYCGFHPKDPEELAEYEDLLKQGFVRPKMLEIFVMESDGSNRRQITFDGALSYGPTFHPGGERIIYSSNLADPEGQNFDLYFVRLDGNDLERITVDLSFEAWPVFSPDGKKIAFVSNRNAKEPEETNIFIADWLFVDPPWGQSR
jgi:Tol biopolymer transport system component